MKTSIIISFYERLGHLQSCLNALNRQTQFFDEVVICDDGSSERTVENLRKIIKNYNFQINHMWSEKNGFRPSVIRNNGIRNAKGDYLVFLDCDFSLVNNGLKFHKEAAEQGRFVAGYCKYLDEEQTKEAFLNNTSETLERLYNSLPDRPVLKEHSRFTKYGLLRKFRLVGPRKQKCLSGHFSILKKDVESVNGFDENFVGWGGEDEDLFLRLSMAGIYGKSVILKSKALHLWHPHELGGKHWKEGSNVEYLYRKNIPVFCENGLIKK